jgi:hypothetical protein
MAYYFLHPEIDTTIYSHPDRTNLNAGHDEILEIVKEKGSSDQIYYPSRVLIKFNNEEIKTTISDIVGVTIFNKSSSANVFTSCSVNLQLSTTEHKNLARVLNLELFAISQSWDEGTGRFSSIPSASNGCSWVFRDNDDVTKTKWTTGSFNTVYGSTGSINASGITEGGGVWYTGSNFTATQQFNNADDLDTNFDVTNIVHKFSASLFNNSSHPTGIENNGFIIKQPDIIETNTSESFGELKYFSVDTHTIYPPKLCFKWDDSSYSANQNKIKNSGELSVSLYRNKEEYNQDEVARFRIHVRDKYPTREFTTTSNNLNVGYFKSTSFYSVRDAHTEEEIIPFDTNFTKLSADSEGMYFDLYMKGFQPERYYRVLFKHINNDGTTIYDSNYHFKVIR